HCNSVTGHLPSLCNYQSYGLSIKFHFLTVEWPKGRSWRGIHISVLQIKGRNGWPVEVGKNLSHTRYDFCHVCVYLLNLTASNAAVKYTAVEQTRGVIFCCIFS